jgi:hypothetical protein
MRILPLRSLRVVYCVCGPGAGGHGAEISPLQKTAPHYSSVLVGGVRQRRSCALEAGIDPVLVRDEVSQPGT